MVEAQQNGGIDCKVGASLPSPQSQYSDFCTCLVLVPTFNVWFCLSLNQPIVLDLHLWILPVLKSTEVSP